MSHDGVAEQIQQHAEQPLPSLTPYCKTGNRAVTLRNSWSHPLSVSHASQLSTRVEQNSAVDNQQCPGTLLDVCNLSIRDKQSN